MSAYHERRGNAPSKIDIFKIFEETQKKFGIFSDNLLTREEFSRLLGINRKTMYRWETGLIFKVSPLAIAYLNRDSPRSLYLDSFQRFVIALIFCLRNSPSYGYDTTQILKFLRLNFMQLKREQFNNWIQSFNKENANV